MKATAALLAVAVALSGLGCVGVIGITDVHPVDPPDGAAPIADAGTRPDAPPVVEEEGGLAIDAGTDAPAFAGKRAFVTSTTTTGSMGGTQGADALCTTTAKNAGLGGTWVAWISTFNGPALARFTSNGPWSRLDRKVVASDRDRLESGSLENAIALTELGTAPATDVVWTGTIADGTPSLYHCQNWTEASTAFGGEVGSPAATSAAWTSRSLTYPLCSTRAHLYCFEQ